MNEFVAHRFGSHESERKPTLEEAKAVEGTNLVLEVNPEGKNIAAWVKMKVGWEEVDCRYSTVYHEV